MRGVGQVSNYAQVTRKVTLPTSTVNVEGEAVPVPVDLAVAERDFYLEQRKKIQENIDSTESDEEFLLKKHERALVQNECNVERYANPLHAFAPHIYHPANHYL